MDVLKENDQSVHKKSKKSKKEKKSKKAKSHKKKKRERSSSLSSSSEEPGSEWIEKAPSLVSSAKPSTSSSKSNQRDEWMTTPSLFPCVTRDQLRAAKQPTEKQKEQEEAKFMLDRPGQSGRELNPYWADGGTGLPSEKPVQPESLALVSTTVGDQGASWLRRALQRAREQAAESGRSLEEVATERWGSLQKLEELLSDAEGRKVSLREERFKGFQNARTREQEHSRKGEWSYSERSYKTPRGDWKRERSNRDGKDYFKGRDNYRDYKTDNEKDNEKYSEKEKPRFEKPDSVSSSSGFRNRNGTVSEDIIKDKIRKPSWSESSGSCEESHRKHYSDRKESHYQHFEDRLNRKAGLPFKKPDDNDNQPKGSGLSFSQGSSNSRSWRKKDPVSELDKKEKAVEVLEMKLEEPESSGSESEVSEIVPKPKEAEVLTDQQMNELAAKLVKAEILGNDELVNQLKKKLESARQTRAANPAAVAAAGTQVKKEQEVVVLTRTDSKGFSRPLQTVSAHPEPLGGRRKKQKAETHGNDGQRVRYFADDDKYSLQDMFQKEKLTTVEDQNEVFAKLAGKDGRQEHDLDMDDIFSERAREKESDGKLEARERDRAIREHQRKQKMLDSCRWCFDSKQLQRHLVIAVGSKSYICVPPYQSLTEGHCLIIPLYHTICGTQLDEDVWEEMQDFRKALVKMFEANDEDCVFFESAMSLNKFPHMVLHCVPLPRESGDMAPIYFKKAILESESEWSTNKKLVDLSKKDIRRSVPKGLPYFSVDFGLQGGFAHVIEDEKLFPRNFAEEIIGGMLDLDHSIWRKQWNENFDKQRRKSLDFSKKWAEFDFTKKLKEKRKRTENSDSDSSSS